MPKLPLPQSPSSAPARNHLFCVFTGLWKLPLLVLLCVALTGRTFAQCDSLFFRYTGTLINSLSLVDSNTILAAGDNGYVIKSVDGGKQWRSLPTFAPAGLGIIKMPTASTGYAIGGNQTIIKTEDQGETWFALNSGLREKNLYNNAALLDAYFIDKDRGFIVGDNGLLLSTKNGGMSWKDSSLDMSDRLTGVAFLNDSTGFICGSYQSLYKTTNAGSSWQKISIGAASNYYALKKITFFNATTGFILGSGSSSFRTTDGGITWTPVTLPSGYTYNDVCFISPSNGFIVGNNAGGLVLVTSDGGSTWSFSLNDYGPSLYCVGTDKAGKRLMMAGGGASSEFLGYNGRNILSSTDGGATFTVQSRNARLRYRDIFFLNDSTGYMVGEYGTALKTSDYGESWQPLKNIPAVINGNMANRIFFTDALHGYAGSDNIFKTADGGQSWTKTTSPGGVTQYIPRQLHFFDEQTGLVLNPGSVYKTVNGGASWQLVVSPSQSNFLMDFAASPGGRALAVGYGGYARISADRGSTWSPANLTTNKFLTSAYFYDDNIGFIGTADTTLFKTTDGGNYWEQINTGIPLQISALHFTDPLAGFMVCNSNDGISWIYQTSDGGLSWRYVRTESEDLSHITGFSTLYMSGGNGMVLKSGKNQRPVLPGYIYGLDSACVNRSNLFTTGPMSGVSYNWSLSGGGVSKPSTNTDSVYFNTPGTYALSLSVSNACGTSATRTFTSTAVVFAPLITTQDSILIATEGLSYQWLRNGGYILAAQGGNARRFVPTLSGSYSVIVQSKYGCSETSPAIPFSLNKQRLLCPGDSTLLYSSQFGTSYQWQRNDGSGFVDIKDDSTYSGTHGSPLHIKNIPTAWYGYTYKCVTNFGTGDTYTLQFVNKWTGAANNSWENPGNWSCGHLPDANTDVVINSGTIVIQSDVTIRSLQLNPSAQLTVTAGNHLIIGH